MATLRSQIISFVGSKGWKTASTDETGVALLFGEKDSDAKNVMMSIDGRDVQKDIRVKCAHNKMTPEKDRKRMAEFVARASWGMNLGCFKIDMRDGETFFEVAADVKYANPDDVKMLLEVFTGVARATMDKYQPGIMAIMNDENLSPKKAVSDIEG